MSNKPSSVSIRDKNILESNNESFGDSTIKSGEGGDSGFSLARQRYTLTILVLVYVFGFVDRQIVNILGETLKKELHILNWQFGLLAGLAFSILYTTIGLPLARFADRGARAKIVAGSVTIWSVFTILCGTAANFSQLFMARVGVGVGEGGFTPASHALISNMVPKEKRASSLAIYSLGVPLGTLMGMIIGGVVADAWGWRAAFFFAGVPGVLLGIVAWLTLREPKISAPVVKAPLTAGFGEILRLSSFRWIVAAISANTFAFFGVVAFSASFFLRVHGDELAVLGATIGLKAQGTLGIALGLSLGLGGIVGTYAGGIVSDRSAKAGVQGYLTVPMLISACYIPLGLIGFTTGNLFLAFLCIAGCGACGVIFYGPSFAALHSLVRPELRATVSALTLTIFNLLGYGLGPLVVGAMNDLWVIQTGASQGDGLRYALITICVVGGLLSFLCYAVARKVVQKRPAA